MQSGRFVSLNLHFTVAGICTDHVSLKYQETATDIIKLEDEPRTIEAMLRFMYGLDYDSGSQGRTSPMLFGSKVYVAADYYGIP